MKVVWKPVEKKNIYGLLMLVSNTYLQWNMTKTTLIATQSFILLKKNMRRLNYIEIPRVVSGTSAANKAQVWLKRIKSAQQGGQGWPRH